MPLASLTHDGFGELNHIQMYKMVGRFRSPQKGTVLSSEALKWRRLFAQAFFRPLTDNHGQGHDDDDDDNGVKAYQWR